MCIAFPMEVVRVDHARSRGVVSSAGLELEVGLDLVEDVAVGDYVIVHAGYAIQRLLAEEARETLALLHRMQALQDPPRGQDDEQ